MEFNDVRSNPVIMFTVKWTALLNKLSCRTISAEGEKLDEGAFCGGAPLHNPHSSLPPSDVYWNWYFAERLVSVLETIRPWQTVGADDTEGGRVSPGLLADGARGGFHNLSDAKGHVRYTPISILHTTNINFTEMKSFRIPLRDLFPFHCLFCASTIRKMCSFRGTWIHKLLTWTFTSFRDNVS